MYQYVKCDIFKDNSDMVEVEWTHDSVKESNVEANSDGFISKL